jgi:hypothetical protein
VQVAHFEASRTRASSTVTGQLVANCVLERSDSPAQQKNADHAVALETKKAADLKNVGAIAETMQ